MFLAEGDFVLFFVSFFLSLQEALNAQGTLCIPISKRYAKKKFVSKNVDQHN